MNLHAGFPDGKHQTQIAHQGILHAFIPNGAQVGGQLLQLLIMANPGQHGSHRHPTGQLPAPAQILGQQVQRHIEHGRLHPQQPGRDLLFGGHLSRQTGTAPESGEMGPLAGLAQGRHIPPGPQGRQLIQCIPAQAVDGGGGQGQPLINLGCNFFAAVGGSAGFADPGAEQIFAQGQATGRLRTGAGDGAAAAFGVGHRQGAAFGGDLCFKHHRNQAVLHGFIGLAHGFEPCVVFVFLVADAEHGLAGLTGVVAVGEALAVEGPEQIIHHLPGHLALVQGLAVDRGDGGYIFRPLHAALQLQGDHAHLLQLLQVHDQTVVLQAQGIPVLPAAVAIALAAGLGAAAPVAGAAADGGGEIALAGVAHAQGAVGENFNFNGGVGADVADFLPAQLPAQHHSGHSPGRAEQHAGEGMDGHLSGAVDCHLGCNLAAQPHHAQILDDESVHAAHRRMTNQTAELFSLPVGNQGIQGQVDGNAPDVAVFHGLHQGLGGEVLGTLTGIEGSTAKIYGVCAILNRGLQRFHGSGRG